MAFSLFCKRVVFIFLFGLSLVHSENSLIDEKCHDALDSFDVEFDGKKTECGKLVSLDSFTEHTPTVKYLEAETGKEYSVVMVDPDAPSASNPTCRSWLHWIVSNIKGDDLKLGKVDAGNTLTDYNPPAPPAGSGPHRYYLVVFEQEHDLDSKITARCHFSIDGYTVKNKLKAVAMNMFETEHE